MVRIDFAAIKVGKPLPWPVFDASGKLLLHKGYVIESIEQAHSLMDRGVYRAKSAAIDDADRNKQPDLSPFCELGEIIELLSKAIQDLLNKSPSCEQRLKTVIEKIQTICTRDPDACIAAIHLYSKTPSAIENAVYYAILCQLVGPSLKLSEQPLKTLLMAALTANTALQPYQKKLNEMGNKLTDKQFELIKKHPRQSSQLLLDAGIKDSKLHEIILQHHESVDGKGYPEGLKEHEISPEAKLISICEHYVALVSERAYRQTKKTNEALREVYRRASKDSQETLYLSFIKTLSVYPPGSFTRLKNGEVTVITHRSKNNKGYQMKAILSPRGGAYMGSFSRDSSITDYKIEETVQPSQLPALNLAELWGYIK